MNSNPTWKAEMDALYHAVKGLDEAQLRQLRQHVEQMRDGDDAETLALVPPGAMLAPGTASLH